jgi:DNA polymerase III sliding clamp (beta) subunit (PCNA family)
MSSEETRLYVNGVYFDHGTPEHPSASSYLTLVATDGRRLTHATFPCPVPTSLPRFIMPSDAVKVILDLLKRRTKHVVLESDGKVFQVTGPDWRVWGPTISNAFPDWRCILPKSDNRLSVDCSAFVTALSPMVKSFKNSNNRHSEKLRVALAKDCIRLKTCDSRDMRATVPANGSQLTSEAIFSVNARHLLDTLKALQVPKCGRVTILPYLESWIVRILADDTDRAGLVVANSS